MVDYEPLPSVTDVAEAAKPGAPVVWDENGDNISHTFERGDKAATDAAFAKAKHIVRRRHVITRVHAQFMEPRGSLGVFDKFEDRYTLYADVNYPHRVRNMLAANVFKVPESQVRVVVNDVGGGFGTKGWQYVDHRLVLWAAKKLDRPVKWRCERSEVIMADEHGRDNVGEIELALDENYKFLGVRLNMLASVGAYIASDRQLLTPFGQIITLTGVYHVPACHVTIDAVLSNTNPTAPYRGAGRPEAIYLMERIIEAAADELGIDRIELRKRNVIQPEQMPYKAPLGQVYDSGTFARNMELALEHGDFAGFAARREASPRQRQTARHRAGQRDRAGRRAGAGIRRGPVPAERFGFVADGHQNPRPGPRDDVQANPARKARHRRQRNSFHRWRHRSGGVRHGLERLALDGHRRHRADHGGGEADRERQEARRAYAGSGRGRHRVRRTTRSPLPAPTARSR